MICWLQETHFGIKDIHKLKVKGWKKIFYENGNRKQARVFILISNKINFKFKIVSRDKESHYIKESIQQEGITIINMYRPTIRAPK